MKKARMLILVLACLFLFAGCSCKHEWTQADCINPETCTKCGETAGEPLGHDWVTATCTTARTCSRCGSTEGDPLGHAWVEATCTEPKTCANCGETIGEALGHTWTEATVEAPKTCTVCGITEGEKIETDPRFVAAEAQRFFGKWESKLSATGTDLGVEGFTGVLDGKWVTTFGESGQMVTEFVVTDEAAFREEMVAYVTQQAYDAFEEQGLNKEQADAASAILTHVDVESYIRGSVGQMEVGALVDLLLSGSVSDNEWNGEFVYYVEGDMLYMGMNWESEMYPVSYEFIGSRLIIAEYTEYTAADAV